MKAVFDYFPGAYVSEYELYYFIYLVNKDVCIKLYKNGNGYLYDGQKYLRFYGDDLEEGLLMAFNTYKSL